MSLFKKIMDKEEKIAVIGLGYVGLPLAIAFAKIASVIGFDINAEKIQNYKDAVDPTTEVGSEALKVSSVIFTDDITMIKQAKFLIITVPTPIRIDKTPDLTYVRNASTLVGQNLSKGAIVIYESTVYPGVTEDICIPLLEQNSGLVCGRDFKVGYSPERINPGDKINRLENIKKVVSAIDESSLEEVAKIYELIIEAGVHRVSTIKTAEATKVAENSQRDVNIAFVNELAMVFNKMGINTMEVIEAMNTKWNALGFYPGLVGGHCISVDPYYFIYEAERLGYHSQIMLAGRKINDDIPNFIVEAIIKKLILANKVIKETKIVIMGVTFKENFNDIRNSKVENIVQILREYGIEPELVDPYADEEEVLKTYKKELTPITEVNNADCIVFAVAHTTFKNLSFKSIDAMYIPSSKNKKIIIDIKHIFNKAMFENYDYLYWSL